LVGIFFQVDDFDGTSCCLAPRWERHYVRVIYEKSIAADTLFALIALGGVKDALSNLKAAKTGGL